MHDENIIDLFWRREESAVRICAMHYRPYCYSIAYSILQDNEDCEECLNDTWLRAWKSIPPARPQVLRLFLAKICRNLAFDRVRYKQAERRKDDAYTLAFEELEEVLASDADVTDEVEYKELVASINRFLGSLPAKERGIFLRRYFYVDTTKEIARQFGVSEENALMILSRVRKKLRKHLSKEGYSV